MGLKNIHKIAEPKRDNDRSFPGFDLLRDDNSLTSYSSALTAAAARAIASGGGRQDFSVSPTPSAWT